MQKPSLTQLKAILRDSAFDPRADGPNKVISDVAINNPRYAEERAVELIREGMIALDTGGVLNVAHYEANMSRAMGLLALAVAVRS